MLLIEDNNRNLGILKFGIPFHFEYKVKNLYSTPILVKKVSPGCHSCTILKWDKKLVLPGEYLTIQVTFTPGSTGINTKQASILYEIEGNSKSDAIKFTAKVD